MANNKSNKGDRTRQRILDVAKVRFSHEGYDGVGVRDLAKEAGVDPALVVRYFGSKEGLFREIAEGAFGIDDLLEGDVSTLPERAAAHLTAEFEPEERAGYDPLGLLLCSAGSSVAGPIVAELFDRDFVQPLAAALRGEKEEKAAPRAATIASYVLGFALIRIAFASPAIQPEDREEVRRLLSEAIRVCL